MGTEMMGGLSYLWRSRCLSIAAKVIRREVIAIRLNLKERREGEVFNMRRVIGMRIMRRIKSRNMRRTWN